MFGSSYSTRLVKAVALLVLVAFGAAPAAQSADIPDAVDRYLHNQAAVNAAREIPDFVDRYVASHSAGKSGDLRSPDTRDIAVGHVPPISPLMPSSPASDFDWSDAGIGATVTAALMLLLLGTRELVVQRRREPSVLSS